MLLIISVQSLYHKRKTQFAQFANPSGKLFLISTFLTSGIIEKPNSDIFCR